MSPQVLSIFLTSEKSLCIEYGAVLLHFFNALISFDRNKINETSLMLRELEKKCTPEQGWFQSIRTKFFGEQREYSSRKSILDDLEREIILADTLLCSSILIGISCDVSSYIKAALILRRAWKIYNQSFKDIHELCNHHFHEESPIQIGQYFKLFCSNSFCLENLLKNNYLLCRIHRFNHFQLKQSRRAFKSNRI